MIGNNDVKQQCNAPKNNINVDLLKVVIMPLIEQEIILKAISTLHPCKSANVENIL